MKFKILWAFDALITLVVLYFFFVGLADGSVSSFNMGLWLVILLMLGSVLAGSLILRSRGKHRMAMAVVLILAVPGLLFGLFFLIMIIANPHWN